MLGFVTVERTILAVLKRLENKIWSSCTKTTVLDNDEKNNTLVSLWTAAKIPKLKSCDCALSVTTWPLTLRQQWVACSLLPLHLLFLFPKSFPFFLRQFLSVSLSLSSTLWATLISFQHSQISLSRASPAAKQVLKPNQNSKQKNWKKSQTTRLCSSFFFDKNSRNDSWIRQTNTSQSRRDSS